MPCTPAGTTVPALTALQKRIEAAGPRVDVHYVAEAALPIVVAAYVRAIQEDQDAAYEVHIDLSAASRLQTVAATFAAMARGVELYGLAQGGVRRPTPIDPPGLDLPNPRGLRVLVELAVSADGLATDDLLLALRRAGFEGFGSDRRASRGEQTNYLMKLNKGVLEPLERRGLLTHREQQGRRKRIRITPAGHVVAALSGLAPVLGPADTLLVSPSGARRATARRATG